MRLDVPPLPLDPRNMADDEQLSEFGLPDGYPHDYYGKVPEGVPVVTVSNDPRI